MKIYKKIIALMILFTMLIPFLSQIVFAVESKEQKYLALGDSIAYGYGLQDRDTQSYSQIVRQKKEITKANFSNLAVSGMTCEEFSEIIKTDNYTKAIKDADIITISIGSNELLSIAIGAVSDVTGVPTDDSEFTKKVQDYFANAGYITKATSAYKLYKYFTSEEAKATINAAIETYRTKWNESVDYIKSINGDVNIIATEFYNPYYEVALASYDLGSYCEGFISQLNAILKEQSNNESRYKIAKIHDDFDTTDPRITNVNIDFSDYSKINIDPHPNKQGHSIIATRVMDILGENKKETKKKVNELTISSIKDYDYIGKEIMPEVIIKDGNSVLKENRDYTLTYVNNVNVGKAIIIIKGIGDYEGTVEKSFNIKSIKDNKKTDISTLNIDEITNQTYMGFKITPDVTIMDENNTLEKNKDYILRYSNNIDVGTANIEIEGIGNYEGTAKTSFEIKPRNIAETSINDIDSYKKTGEEIKPKVKITFGSINLKEGTDFDAIYKDNIDVGTATITIKGIGNFAGETTINFEIEEADSQDAKKDISGVTISDVGDQVYTGKVITPEVEIKDSDTYLKKDVDYKLSYENNLNIGMGKIIITGIGEYSNTVEKEFEITKKDINFTKVLDIDDQIYNNKEIKPEVIITSDGIKLKEGEDYTLEYFENNSIGTASIKITGIGNYKGEMVKTFNIISKDQEEKEKEEEKKENNTKSSNVINEIKDTTVSNKILPNTGTTLALITLSVIISLAGVFSYYKYYINKDIK